jgi:SAM-dependent methyltransferase
VDNTRKSFLRKFILSFLIFLNNHSYYWIKFFVSGVGVHPKHAILRYDKFFKDNLDENDVVLDIGCGNGHLAKKVAEKVRKVVAIDFSERNIKTAKEKHIAENVEYILGDATTYELNDNFDAIILSNVLEHIKDRVEFLKKIKKLSNKILIRIPMLDRDWLTVYKKENGFEYRLDNTHCLEYTLDILNDELDHSGWELKKYSIQFGELWGEINKK